MTTIKGPTWLSMAAVTALALIATFPLWLWSHDKLQRVVNEHHIVPTANQIAINQTNHACPCLRLEGHQTFDKVTNMLIQAEGKTWAIAMMPTKVFIGYIYEEPGWKVYSNWIDTNFITTNWVYSNLWYYIPGTWEKKK